MNRREMLKNSATALVSVADVGSFPSAAQNRAKRYVLLRTEGRCRNLRISPALIETILGGWHNGFDFLTLPVLSGLPPDIILGGVYFDEWNQWFVLRIMHESFDPVPDGAETPPLDKNWTEYICMRRLSEEYRPN